MIFNPAKILLPKFCADSAKMGKWSVVACDQYTSQPKYWEDVQKYIGKDYSTYNMILPEIYLNNGDCGERIKNINHNIYEYINDGIFFKTKPCYIYVERTMSSGRIRRGLMGCIDLEQYDFKLGSKSKIRATEGTVLERIPPRLKVRKNAPIEFAHIMLLVDDVKKEIIEPLSYKKDSFDKLYDFKLMAGGGRIAGYKVDEKTQKKLETLLDGTDNLKEFNKKYNVSEQNTLCLAVGDGNHSLATAKQHYENLKAETGEENAKNSPARYALCELVNLNDSSLEFEPIHRVIFDTDADDFISAMSEFYDLSVDGKGGQRFTLICEKGARTYKINNPRSNITVGSVQQFIDEYTAKKNKKTDYIHGDAALKELASRKNTVGILLGAMNKGDLFKTVIIDGALPRKTFSMGEACDKRYYLEGRKIIE